MQEYAIGTVCVLLDAHDFPAKYKKYVGMECTIVGGLVDHGQAELQYSVSFQGEKEPWLAVHRILKPKYPPKDAAFDSFLNRLLQPCDIDEKETV